MTTIEIVIIIFCALVVFFNIAAFIYRKIKHMPTGECRYCGNNINKMLKEYRKMYKNK